MFIPAEVVDAVAKAERVGERDPGAERDGAREGGGAVARGGEEVTAAGERAVVAAAGADVPVDAHPVAGEGRRRAAEADSGAPRERAGYARVRGRSEIAGVGGEQGRIERYTALP